MSTQANNTFIVSLLDVKNSIGAKRYNLNIRAAQIWPFHSIYNYSFSLDLK